MNQLRYFIPMALFLVLAVFLYKGLGLNPRQLDSTLINKAAPAFNLPQVGDSTQVLRQTDLLGHVSLLNVWASWCVSCRQEHPLLMQLAKQKTIHLYGLNWKDDLSAARAWLSEHGDPYLASGFDHTGRTGINYGVTGTPETFVLDKQGVVRHKQVGPISKEIFLEVLWPLIQRLEAEPAPLRASS